MSRRYWNVAYEQPHAEGRPVGRSTYVHYGCRCDGCRAANTEEQKLQDAKRREASKNDHPAGKPYSESTYRNWGCRCDQCRAAHSDSCKPYSLAWRRRQGMRPQAELRTLPRDSRCPLGIGNYSGYSNLGCRCEFCRAAQNAYKREYRARRRAS